MKLHFLGTTGYHPNRRRDTSCLMIPELGIILDAGTGIFRAREHIATPELHIFLSHIHIDHCIGLTYLLDVLRDQPVKSTYVYCAPEQELVLKENLFHPKIFPVLPPIKFKTLRHGNLAIPGGGKMRTFPLPHPGGCTGFRMEWPGHSMAFVTDTTAAPNAPYLKHLKDVDLLVHECYFPDGVEDRAHLTGHSCLTPVAQLAAAAQVKRLYLTHINPMNEGKKPFDLKSVAKIFSAITVPEDDDFVEF